MWHLEIQKKGACGEGFRFILLNQTFRTGAFGLLEKDLVFGMEQRIDLLESIVVSLMKSIRHTYILVLFTRPVVAIKAFLVRGLHSRSQSSHPDAHDTRQSTLLAFAYLTSNRSYYSHRWLPPPSLSHHCLYSPRHLRRKDCSPRCTAQRVRGRGSGWTCLCDGRGGFWWRRCRSGPAVGSPRCCLSTVEVSRGPRLCLCLCAVLW